MNKFKTYTSMLGSSNWTAINNNLTRAFGDITISAVYSRLLSLQEYFGENKDFFQTYEQIATYFGINEYQASKAVLFLVKNGFISCRKKGLPSRPYYLFTESNFDLVQQLLESIDNEGKSLDATNAKMTTVVSLNPESLQSKYDNPIISKSKESKSKEVNNIESAVFSKNDHASEIDSLRNEIEELKSLIEQKNKVEADGAKCNNVANTELAVLSESIELSYTKAQESKDNPVKSRKKANSGTLLKDCETLTNKELFIQEFNRDDGGYFQRFKDTFDAGMIWDIEINNMLNYVGFQYVKRANWLQAAANWIGKMKNWGVDYNACLKKNAPTPKNEGYDENDPRTWK